MDGGPGTVQRFGSYSFLMLIVPSHHPFQVPNLKELLNLRDISVSSYMHEVEPPASLSHPHG